MLLRSLLLVTVLLPAYAFARLDKKNNVCTDIPFGYCLGRSTDINGNVTIERPAILLEGNYWDIGYAPESRSQDGDSGKKQRQDLCRFFNLGAPVNFEASDISMRTLIKKFTTLELSYKNDQPSVTPVTSMGAYHSITCKPN